MVCTTVELKGFRDASPKAYKYIEQQSTFEVIDRLEQVSSQLVIPKSGGSPIKAKSLPRKELLAAVVNARSLKLVVDTEN